MKITRVRCHEITVTDVECELPAQLRKSRSRQVTTIVIGTNQGIEGVGLAFTLGGLARALTDTVEELATLIVGEDPRYIEAILTKLQHHAGNMETCGLYLLAQSAIDIALWDIRGKALNQPLWQLAGGARDKVIGYSSGAVTREMTDAEAEESAVHAASQGFQSIKMHLALDPSSPPHMEVERVKLIREALGRDVALGCDINERWSLPQAIDIGSRLEEFELAWLEDPVHHTDYSGLGQVTARLSTPVMAGERAFGVAPFHLLLNAKCVDFLMIDVMTVGGITNWLKVAHMAEAHNIPVVSHLLPEIQAALICGVRNGHMSEYKSWLWSMFEEPPLFEDGRFVMNDRPGLGLTFRDGVVST